MPHRKVTDQHGHDWDVWDVNPSAIDRRLQAQPHTPDRRKENVGFIGRVNPRLREGWLTFQCENEKRRLTPVPQCWEQLSDPAMLHLLDRASKTGRPARLIE
jgi:hypothetical protein